MALYLVGAFDFVFVHKIHDQCSCHCVHISGDELFKQRLKFRIGRRTQGSSWYATSAGHMFLLEQVHLLTGYLCNYSLLDIKQYGIVGEL